MDRKRMIMFAGKAIVAVILVAILLAISPFGFLYLVFGGEEHAIKKAIDNPYVNDRYRGWHTVEVNKDESFKLPEKWSFLDESDCYKILNEENELWAIGAKFETSSDLYSNRSDFLSSCLGKNIQTIHYNSNDTSPNFVYMDGSDAGLLCLQAEQEEQYFYMQLASDTNEEFFWVVLANPSNDQYLTQIMEAIIYSFEYG